MSKADEIIKQIDHLTNEECKIVFDLLKNRLDTNKFIVLGRNYDWWNNELDDTYNKE
jgi:hypothetical protein